MCEPTTVAVLAMASTAVSAYAQHETAKAQKEQIRTQAENERQEQYETDTEELGLRIREQRERRARARVAAGESGALGASFAASINQSLVDSDMDAALVAKKSAFAQRGIEDRKNMALSQVRDPSALEAGLQIASAGVSGYSAGLGIQNLTKGAAKTTEVATGAMSKVANPPTTNIMDLYKG